MQSRRLKTIRRLIWYLRVLMLCYCSLGWLLRCLYIVDIATTCSVCTMPRIRTGIRLIDSEWEARSLGTNRVEMSTMGSLHEPYRTRRLSRKHSFHSYAYSLKNSASSSLSPLPRHSCRGLEVLESLATDRTIKGQTKGNLNWSLYIFH